MKIKQVVSFLLTIVIIVSAITSQSGCASIIPPTGGPRDTLPPFLVRVNPPDSTKKFVGKKIIFEFDEYVQLDNIQQNLIVSPMPKILPIVQSKLRNITIELKDTLEENTTYSLDFGNALKDLNEGNPYRNFTYLFSTGQQLDSLQLSGKVFVAETGKSDSTMIVMLYKNSDDSAVIKERPRYIARVKADGSFRFHNMGAGTFSIYALKDEGARRYQSKEQLFAFADSTVATQSMKNDIVLYAFTEKEKKAKSNVSTITPGVKAGGKKNNEDADRYLKVQTNLSGNQLDLLSNLSITFSAPLLSFDSSKLQLLNEAFEPIKTYTLERDTGNKKITVIYPWTENTSYHVILDSLVARDTLGKRIARIDTVNFQTKKESEYGLVRLRFLNLDLKKHPVLQFIQTDQVKFSHVFKNNQFDAKLFTPGEYEIRLVYDDNQNGEWDTGEFFGKRLQPEKVQLIPRKLNIKANWDNEVDIQL
ncbi:MAG: Ig-like domain-containing protein [Flavitalea sp.]